MTASHWFVVRTNIKAEGKARTNLSRAGFGVYLPEMKIERQHKRTKKWLVKTLCLMPRYIFVEMPDDDPNWYALRRCEGVECVLGINGTPQPVPAEHISRLTGMQANMAFDDTREAKVRRQEIGRNKRETTKMRFPVGTKVRAKDGPFRAFRGFVTNVKAKGEVEVMLELFGRLTPVDFPLEYLEALEQQAA